MTILKVEAPYHFGWEHEWYGGERWTEISLENLTTDRILYKDEVAKFLIKVIGEDGHSLSEATLLEAQEFKVSRMKLATETILINGKRIKLPEKN